eukprot:754920-Hanusia_phi.AAC.3
MMKSIQYVPKTGKSEKELLEQFRGRDGKFVDPEFPASARSLFVQSEAPLGHVPVDEVQWLRPSEFVPKLAQGRQPQLFVDGANPSDVVQGALGDCWFLSALSCVASRRDLLRNLFASTEFGSQGIYTIRFYKNGRWKYITIDDRIPCSPSGEPLYARCKDVCEIWVMLIEKAYAKIHGRCYRNLETGAMTFALKDLTGGDPHLVNLLDPQTRDECENGFLWQKLKLWMKQNSLCGCSFSINKGEARYQESDGGILKGHAYSIIDLKEYRDLRFLQVRNPWGRKEWTGRWADFAPEWERLREKYPDAPDWMLNYVPENDGTFWMLFADFCKYFNMLFICIRFPPSWSEELLRGRWEAAFNSGGSPDKRNLWWTSPTYKLTVSTRTQFSISMSQWDARCYGNKSSEMHHEAQWNRYDNAIGFLVTTVSAIAHAIKRSENGLDSSLRAGDVIARGYPFKRDRDVSLQVFPLVLDPNGGPYAVIAMTHTPNVDGKFYLTVRSNKPVKIEQVNMSGSAALEYLKEAEEEEEEEEEDDEEPDEFLKTILGPEDPFIEKPAVIRLQQPDIIELCNRHVICEPIIFKDTDNEYRFYDAEFMAEELSIFSDPSNPSAAVQLAALDDKIQNIRWLRPSQISYDSLDVKIGAERPKLYPKESQAMFPYVAMGALGDSWFVGALALLASRPELVRQLFVGYTSPSCENCGIYTVRFYKNGKWVNITVDDRLPATLQGNFLFSRSQKGTELWLPVLEKAYAKLHGCYELLFQGSVQYALKDLTGGVPQVTRMLRLPCAPDLLAPETEVLRPGGRGSHQERDAVEGDSSAAQVRVPRRLCHPEQQGSAGEVHGPGALADLLSHRHQGAGPGRDR